MADNERPWTADVSFSTRLENISNILQALQSDEQHDPSTSPAEARTLESTAYRLAQSLEEYNARCNDFISAAEQDDAPIEETIPAATTAVTLGKYAHATHYRNGLFSEVYKAPKLPAEPPDNTDPTFVALKVTTPPMMVAPHDSEREARILRQLKECQYVTPLLDSFRASGSRFVLVFPFLPLSMDVLIARRRLGGRTAKLHTKSLFSALQFLHSHGIIHRDVKPSNILLRSASGPAFLSDFGIAWSSADSASEPSFQKITDVGTSCYRPPEILFGKTHYDATLDIWAAGCTVAEMVNQGSGTLFDSGDVGTELALIQSIFMKLGTPDENVWPSANDCPDWGKMQWKDFPPKPWSDLLPSATATACDLVSNLVVYEQSRRLPAGSVLKHPYFSDSNE